MFSYIPVSSIDGLVSDYADIPVNNWYAKHNWSHMIYFPLSSYILNYYCTWLAISLLKANCSNVGCMDKMLIKVIIAS